MTFLWRLDMRRASQSQLLEVGSLRREIAMAADTFLAK